MFSTSTRAGRPFTAGLETERIPEGSGWLEAACPCSTSRTGEPPMADTEGQGLGGAGLVFAVHNNHDERCDRPPRLRNTDHLGLYYDYFENRYGEQFVFTFDRVTLASTVSVGDLDWGDSKSFTMGFLE
jgi:hypothetical protein